MKNVKLTIAYDGTAFSGWQRQENARTVQQVIEEALRAITGEETTITGAGRTDAGVHARGQVANFHTAKELPAATFQAALNATLPPDIAILDAEEVGETFHARHHARRKRYEYVLWNAPVRPVFERHFAWHVPGPLDVASMAAAARRLIGEHDFRAFAREVPPEKDCVRALYELSIVETRPRVVFTFQGSGFLHTMVRSLVGTLLLVGHGKATPDDVAAILRSRDRTVAGPTAPPHGLTLAEVAY
ncbi:MAG: tRNA pseudouridine(38-40) synthase TruA [Planctomycetota bacterium]